MCYFQPGFTVTEVTAEDIGSNRSKFGGAAATGRMFQIKTEEKSVIFLCNTSSEAESWRRALS